MQLIGDDVIVRSALLFVLAGLMEIGGGYLMWLWLREKWAWWMGVLGAFVLVGYGIIPTLQPAHLDASMRRMAEFSY